MFFQYTTRRVILFIYFCVRVCVCLCGLGRKKKELWHQSSENKNENPVNK